MGVEPKSVGVFGAAMAMAAVLLTCGDPPPECPPPVQCPPPPPKCAWGDGPRVCPAVQQLDPSQLTDPPLRLALEALQNMFEERFDPVRALLTPELAAELPTEKLTSIVRGLVDAHGPPVQLMDVFRTSVREKKDEASLPAVQALVRMTNEVRVSLLIVFTPTGQVRGFWLRPI